MISVNMIELERELLTVPFRLAVAKRACVRQDAIFDEIDADVSALGLPAATLVEFECALHWYPFATDLTLPKLAREARRASCMAFTAGFDGRGFAAVGSEVRLADIARRVSFTTRFNSESPHVYIITRIVPRGKKAKLWALIVQRRAEAAKKEFDERKAERAEAEA